MRCSPGCRSSLTTLPGRPRRGGRAALAVRRDGRSGRPSRAGGRGAAQDVRALVYLGCRVLPVGYGGLILAPTTPHLALGGVAGHGPLLFPLALVLINLRTRTHDGAVALSGFVQRVGYTLGAFGPLVVGLLHQVTGGWTSPSSSCAARPSRPRSPARSSHGRTSWRTAFRDR